MRRLGSLMTMGALMLALAGCGGAGDGGETAPDDDEPATTAPTSDITAELTIVVRDQPDTHRRYELTCPPADDADAGGDQAQACQRLAENTDALDPVPGDVACAELYGGPETAQVTGTLNDEPVSATFDRTDSCEIDRYDRMAQVWELLEPVETGKGGYESDVAQPDTGQPDPGQPGADQPDPDQPDRDEPAG